MTQTVQQILEELAATVSIVLMDVPIAEPGTARRLVADLLLTVASAEQADTVLSALRHKDLPAGIPTFIEYLLEYHPLLGANRVGLILEADCFPLGHTPEQWEIPGIAFPGPLVLPWQIAAVVTEKERECVLATLNTIPNVHKFRWQGGTVTEVGANLNPLTA